VADVMLTRSQAYDAVREYLAEFLRQSTNASLGTVLSDLNPHVWADGQPVDPAVPFDWSNAAAAVAALSPELTSDADNDQALPGQTWLTALFPFLTGLWPILGRVPLSDLLQVLAQKDVPIIASELSPWQAWLSVTQSIVIDCR
jgi:hypothetical protein